MPNGSSNRRTRVRFAEAARRTVLGIGCLLVILVAARAIGAYGLGLGGGLIELPVPRELREGLEARSAALGLHVLGSAVALLLGPTQFSSVLRSRRPALHRNLGRVYLGAAVPLGGLAGLYLSRYAHGGIVTRVGFGLLAVAWLYTAVLGFRTARAKNFTAHRLWMMRNYSLTLAAVTLRVDLTIAFLLRLPFEPSYQVVSWLCWVPNLLVAERIARAARRDFTESK